MSADKTFQADTPQTGSLSSHRNAPATGSRAERINRRDFTSLPGDGGVGLMHQRDGQIQRVVGEVVLWIGAKT